MEIESKKDDRMLTRRDVSKLLVTGGAGVAGSLLAASPLAAAKVSTSPLINARDYGAVGDGQTDDQPAIQAALDSVGVHGGYVFLPAGRYLVGAPLFIKSKVNGAAGCVLGGSGQNCVITAGPGFPGNVAMLYILGGYAHVTDLGLDGADLAQNGIEYAYSSPDQPDDRTVSVSFVAFARMRSNGFHCVGGEIYQIRDCFFNSLGGYAVYSRDGGINSFVSGNYMLGCGGVYLGAVKMQPEGVRILNNTILCSAGAGMGVYVEKGLEIQVSNNVIDQVKNSSIYVGGNSSYVKCTDNWLSAQNSNIACSVGQNANSITFIGNTFEGGSFQLSVAAQQLGDIHDVSICNNIFNNATDTAMFLDRATRVTIIGNHCRASGKESLFWGYGLHGIAMGNMLWKGPNAGKGLMQSNNIGW
ncbi:right-handed parallel beta-helix repeat-containing protein [Xanthomonas oryzae]|uniref:Glycosyl hydrolase family 28-related protein n=1 Tax=Xanthomonas oryzae pv. leersiae TaxID=3112258 RepID=A0AAJ6KMA0_9XANT|nr:glycosyl hydrolase family 28-related protein [Xanthomonas oryzae]WIX08132.1 glycosyl hydrolase family 28-related protein [Xanthomonas oryzae pv. oryzae]